MSQIENAGVAALANLVLTLESEVLELMSEKEVTAAFHLSFASTATNEMDATVGILPTCGNSVLTVTAPSVKACAIIKNIVAVGIHLQLREVVLLVINDSCAILRSIRILLLDTILSSFAVAITLLLTAASSQEHRCKRSNIDD